MKKELLKHRELVSFKVGSKTLRYNVNSSFLAREESRSNSLIFDWLGIKNKNAFCTEFYGYEAGYGDFPTCKGDDYAALTRVYNALQELCDKHNGVTKEITYEIY